MTSKKDNKKKGGRWIAMDEPDSQIDKDDVWLNNKDKKNKGAKGSKWIPYDQQEENLKKLKEK